MESLGIPVLRIFKCCSVVTTNPIIGFIKITEVIDNKIRTIKWNNSTKKH